MYVGVIGTGLIGSNLVRCLVKKGYSIVVYNRSHWKAEELARETGVEVVNTPRELFDRAGVAIAFISGDEALYDIVYREDGVVYAREGSVLVNASTVTPIASSRTASYLEKHGIGYVEAPVYGSTSEAMECRVHLFICLYMFLYELSSVHLWFSPFLGFHCSLGERFSPTPRGETSPYEHGYRYSLHQLYLYHQ